MTILDFFPHNPTFFFLPLAEGFLYVVWLMLVARLRGTPMWECWQVCESAILCVCVFLDEFASFTASASICESKMYVNAPSCTRVWLLVLKACMIRKWMIFFKTYPHPIHHSGHSLHCGEGHRDKFGFEIFHKICIEKACVSLGCPGSLLFLLFSLDIPLPPSSFSFPFTFNFFFPYPFSRLSIISLCFALTATSSDPCDDFLRVFE